MTDEQPDGVEDTAADWSAQLASIMSADGSGRVIEVTPGIWEEARVAVKDPDDLVHPAFYAVGSLMTSTASLEHVARLLTSYLLNPALPGWAGPSVRSLSANSVRQVARSLIVQRWPDTKRLMDEMGLIAQARNRYAHNPLSSFHLSDDGSRIVRELTLETVQSTPEGFREVREPTSVEAIVGWVNRADLANRVSREVIRILTVLAPHEGRPVMEAPLEAIFEIAASSPSVSAFVEGDRELFDKFY
ncbi:hypothetical protein AAEP80_14115 [Curtobacterium sp. L3-7]|uniref:hypothetical protein n=1 Tax=Curtobacterium sp. L3-7 TaxID=3138787 RepID=UPI003B52336C